MNGKTEREETFSKKALEWAKDNLREFPWRKQFQDLFRTLCVEVLLQKTSAEQVEAIYEDFFAKFPNFETLRKASRSEIVEVIRPTGLYNKKSKALKGITQFLSHEPLSEEGVEELDSVGWVSDYVVNAVLCFSYGKKVPLLEVNVRRILSRVFSESDDSRIRDLLLLLIDNLTEGQVRTFYLALFDIGSTVCTVKNPSHSECPFQEVCNEVDGN